MVIVVVGMGKKMFEKFGEVLGVFFILYYYVCGVGSKKLKVG